MLQHEYKVAYEKDKQTKMPNLEVTDALFKYLRPYESVDGSFTHGSPGVRVFKEGLREDILAEEAMGAEDLYNLKIKAKRKNK